MKRFLSSCLLGLLVWAGLGLPARAQEEPLEQYRGRLPHNTLFYVSWKGLDQLPRLRGTNPLLRFVESPEMKDNWRAVKTYFEQAGEFERKRRAAAGQKGTGASGAPDKSQAGDKKAEAGTGSPRFDLSWDEFVRLVSTPGLLAVVPVPSVAAGKSGETVAMVFLQDMTGLEDLNRQLAERWKASKKAQYEFEGLTVEQWVDAAGKTTSYEARLGRWAAGSDNQQVAEAWFRALRAAPAARLEEAPAYRRARAYADAESQVELFVNVGALTDLLKALPVTETQPPTHLTPGTVAEAFGLGDWDSVLLNLRLEPARLRYQLAGLYAADRGDSPRFLAAPVADFASLRLAPADALSYSVSETNLGALWAYLERAVRLLLPPQQGRLVAGAQGMVEGLMGVTLAQLADSWGPEFSQFAYIPEAGDDVRNLYAMQVRDRDRALTVLRNLLPLLAGRLDVGELSEGSGPDEIFYFSFSLPGTAESEPKPMAALALTREWLLIGPSQDELKKALARSRSGPFLADSLALRAMRARLPAALSTFGFSDLEAWLERGRLEEGLAEVGRQIDAQVRARQTSGSEEKQGACEAESKSAETASGRVEPSPETAPPEFPRLKLPRGLLQRFFSGTTRDTQGFHHLGVVE